MRLAGTMNALHLRAAMTGNLFQFTCRCSRWHIEIQAKTLTAYHYFELESAKFKARVAAAQDSQDPNPLIRALAVRTMGCIRVDKITEYLCDPLQRTLKACSPELYHLQGIKDFSHSSKLYTVICYDAPRRTTTRMCAKLRRCASQNYTTSTRSLWRTAASWTPSRCGFLKQMFLALFYDWEEVLGGS